MRDLGSGGVVLFPTNNQKFPYLAATAGKDGICYCLIPSLGPPLDAQLQGTLACADRHIS